MARHPQTGSLLQWDPSDGGAQIEMYEIFKSNAKPNSPEFNTRIVIVKNAELTPSLVGELRMKASEQRSQMAAAIYLEEQLGHYCSRPQCLNIVKKIIKSGVDAKFNVKLVGNYWVRAADYQRIKNIPGVYLFDSATGSVKAGVGITSNIEWPEELKEPLKNTAEDADTPPLPGGKLVGSRSSVIPIVKRTFKRS